MELAADRLRTLGPAAITLDQLCAAADRTRGSFYHHFVSVDRLLVELAQRWRASETDAIAAEAASAPDPAASLATMARLTDSIDHRLERGVRVLAMSSAEVATLVEEADLRREAVMRDLLGRAYRLGADEAASAARLFHALHQAAVMRSPDDIRGFTRPTVRHLVEWLSGLHLA